MREWGKGDYDRARIGWQKDLEQGRANNADKGQVGKEKQDTEE